MVGRGKGKKKIKKPGKALSSGSADPSSPLESSAQDSSPSLPFSGEEALKGKERGEPPAADPPLSAEGNEESLLSPGDPNRTEPGTEADSGEKQELLGFQLGNEEYAILIQQVKEIIRPPEMTAVPRSSSILLGLISLRGVIIPVFNLRNKIVRLQSDDNPDSRNPGESSRRIIILQIDQGLVGLLVDGVTDVIKIKEEDLEPPPPLLKKEGQEMIRGMTRYKNRLIILLHLKQVMDVIDRDMRMPAAV